MTLYNSGGLNLLRRRDAAMTECLFFSYHVLGRKWKDRRLAPSRQQLGYIDPMR